MASSIQAAPAAPVQGPAARGRSWREAAGGIALAAALALPAPAAPVPAALNLSLETATYDRSPWGLTRFRDIRCRDSQGCLHMAQVSTFPADQIGLLTDITVSNADDLQAALAAAPEGATIRLLAGDYGTLTLSGFSKDVTLVADRDAPAVLRGLDLDDAQGLTFDGLVFDYTPEAGHPLWHVPFSISGSRDITIRNALFDGGDAFGTGTVDDGYGTATGLGIGSSSGIVLEGSEITGFWKGLRMGENSDVVIRGNDFHGLRSDGITMGGMTDTLIEDNHFHDMRAAPGSGDHNDMIQLTSAGTDSPTTGLTIRGNVINIAGGTGSQSLFLSNNAARDGAGPEMFYRDFVIEDNLIVNAHWNGLVVGQIDGLVLRNNTVLHADPLVETSYGDSVPVIQVHPDSRNVTIADNVTGGLIGHEGQADWTVSGTIAVQNGSPNTPTHYSAHFLDPTGDFALDLAKLTVRPDSVIAQEGAGASMLRETDASDSLTPRILSEQQADNRAVYVFDAAMTTGPEGRVDDGMAEFLWSFSDGTTARGLRVEHQFTGPGTHTGTLTVTMADGTTATARTVATVQGGTVMSFDAAAGTLVMHGADGPRTLAEAPLADDPGGTARLLDLGALDDVLTLPSGLLDPVHAVGRMEIDMRLAALPDNDGSGEIMRQHEVFVVVVRKGEIKLAIQQADETWISVTSSGAQLGSGTWHDVMLVHDTAAARLEIWIDGRLNAATDGVGPLIGGSTRDVTLGGPFSHTAFDAVLERLEFRTDPGLYDFAMPPDGQQAPEAGMAPAPEDDARLDRPDLDTLRADIAAGTSPLTLHESDPDSPNIWADRGGSLLVGDDGWDRLRDRVGDDVMHGGAGPDQFVFDMRHMQRAQTDRILDLDFEDRDVVRFIQGDGLDQVWLSSVADIQDAVAQGIMTATLDAGGTALVLGLASAPQHLVEIDLHAGFAWPEVA